MTQVVSVVSPDPPADDDQFELELLIREARRRQRRRRGLTAVVLALAAAGVYFGVQVATSAPRSGSLLARRLHLPSLGPGGRCPATSGKATNTSYFAGSMFGSGPVRVSIGNPGDAARGQVVLGTTGVPRWHALETIWFAMPGYDGPFMVRAARLGKPGPIEVQPGGTGLSPGSGPLVAAAGPTSNSYPDSGRGASKDYYRTVPGSTWVQSPGCYAWQVDGRGFSDVIVVKLLAPR